MLKRGFEAIERRIGISPYRQRLVFLFPYPVIYGFGSPTARTAQNNKFPVISGTSLSSVSMLSWAHHLLRGLESLELCQPLHRCVNGE